MSNELRTPKLSSGDYWAVVFNPSNPGQVRHVSNEQWVDLSSAAAGDVAITLNSQASTGYHTADLPSGLDSTARYTFSVLERAGGSPAWTDEEVAVGQTGPTPARDHTGAAILPAADYTAPNNSGIADAKTAAESVDGKLTTARAAKLDRDLAHAGDADTYKADLSSLGSSGITQISNVLENGKHITTVRGDDYTVGSPRGSLDWVLEDSAPDLTGATVKFTSRRRVDDEIELEVAGTVVNPTGPDKTLRVELTHEQTAQLTASRHSKSNKFDVEVTLADETKWTPVMGGVVAVAGGHTIVEDQSRPSA